MKARDCLNFMFDDLPDDGTKKVINVGASFFSKLAKELAAISGMSSDEREEPLEPVIYWSNKRIEFRSPDYYTDPRYAEQVAEERRLVDFRPPMHAVVRLY